METILGPVGFYAGKRISTTASCIMSLSLVIVYAVCAAVVRFV